MTKNVGSVAGARLELSFKGGYGPEGGAEGGRGGANLLCIIGVDTGNGFSYTGAVVLKMVGLV